MTSLAQSTLALIERGTYTTPTGAVVTLGEDCRDAVSGTQLFNPEALATLVGELQGGPGAAPQIELRVATTQAAAQALASEGDCVLLNFASGVRPGGGFLSGVRAQEEDLCRCSALYPTLLAQPGFYEANQAHRAWDHTDHAIYSPRVPFFRVRGYAPLLEAPFRASVISMPAPNLRYAPRTPPTDAVTEIFRRRWSKVLALAIHQGHRTVLLGAWGCGAFRNDPYEVARAARDTLDDPRFAGHLDRVVFAIPEMGPVSRLCQRGFRQQLFGGTA